MGLSMGSYLSTPKKEKFSSDESNDKLFCGASSMQGWRLTQEDAHNCILDYDTNTSFFAVYDGHGGHEVAEYCSKYLPDYIKQIEAYKSDDIKNALIEGFLGFDATITKPEVIKELKKIAQEKKVDETSDEEEDVDNLYEEAAMPIEQVIEKYTFRSVVNKDSDSKSPNKQKQENENENDVGSSSGCSSSVDPSASCSYSACSEGSSDAVGSSSNEENEAKCVEKQDDKNINTNKNEGKDESKEEPTVTATATPDSSNSKDSNEAEVKNVKEAELPIQNGDASKPEDVTSSSPSQENGDISKKGKGKAPMKKNTQSPSPLKDRPKRNAAQLYKKILNFTTKEEEDDSEDSEDEEDKTFSIPNEGSSDDEEINTTVEGENSDATSEEEEEEDDDEDDDEDDYNEFEELDNIKEEPGSDSGCTAVVAVLKGNELHVANAGDSRCVVCRNGKAIEMSFDHKPEDTIEHQRITKAGGRVSSDGRVNNGLNLSRAIGDHAYKQNKELSDREQMITSLPDIKTLTINPKEDEFMVLACDGIWNSMESQEVVDFVRSRITEGRDKLSHICEELFDHCLADDSAWDGVGMDNMTAIIVEFKSTLLKRNASPDRDSESSSAKIAKTETNESHADTTA